MCKKNNLRFILKILIAFFYIVLLVPSQNYSIAMKSDPSDPSNIFKAIEIDRMDEKFEIDSILFNRNHKSPRLIHQKSN